jgi:hypothetical protein
MRNGTRFGALLLLGLLLGLPVFGCSTVQNAAAQDPMRCERDPKCASHAEKSRDCITVCVDDPACIDRCRQVTGQGAYTR